MINANPVRPLDSSPTPSWSSPVTSSPASTTSFRPAVPAPMSSAVIGGMPPSNKPPLFKRRFTPKMIAGILFFLLLVVGAGAGFYLTQMNQDVRQQAAVDPYGGGGSDTSCGGIGATKCEGNTVYECADVAGVRLWKSTSQKCGVGEQSLTCYGAAPTCTQFTTSDTTCPAPATSTKPSGCTSGSDTTGACSLGATKCEGTTGFQCASVGGVNLWKSTTSVTCSNGTALRTCYGAAPTCIQFSTTNESCPANTTTTKPSGCAADTPGTGGTSCTSAGQCLNGKTCVQNGGIIIPSGPVCNGGGALETRWVPRSN